MQAGEEPAPAGASHAGAALECRQSDPAVWPQPPRQPGPRAPVPAAVHAPGRRAALRLGGGEAPREPGSAHAGAALHSKNPCYRNCLSPFGLCTGASHIPAQCSFPQSAWYSVQAEPVGISAAGMLRRYLTIPRSSTAGVAENSLACCCGSMHMSGHTKVWCDWCC